jgi:hypothetical protein
MIFLFPSDYFNPKQVDEMYLEQAASLNKAGFNTAAICLESLGDNSPKISPPLPQNSEVVYRGWMLSPSEYELLVNAVESAGSFPFTSQAEYLLTHYLPNWYPAIADLTPATKFYTVDDDLESELRTLGWENSQQIFQCGCSRAPRWSQANCRDWRWASIRFGWMVCRTFCTTLGRCLRSIALKSNVESGRSNLN